MSRSKHERRKQSVEEDGGLFYVSGGGGRNQALSPPEVETGGLAVVVRGTRFDLLRVRAGRKMPAYGVQNRVFTNPLASYSRLLQVWRIPASK